jgi:hypothetical protein
VKPSQTLSSILWNNSLAILDLLLKMNIFLVPECIFQKTNEHYEVTAILITGKVKSDPDQ